MRDAVVEVGGTSKRTDDAPNELEGNRMEEVERETGFEPATSTLASRSSAKERAHDTWLN
jgi:hypothetical protein